MTRARRGLTQLEMIAALIVGLLLTLSLAALLLHNRQNELGSGTQARIKLQQALTILGHSVRNAGYFGCAASLAETDLTAVELIGTAENPVLILRGSEVLADSTQAIPGEALLSSSCNGIEAFSPSQRLPIGSELLQPYQRRYFLHRQGLWRQTGDKAPQLLLSGIRQWRVELVSTRGEILTTGANVSGIRLYLTMLGQPTETQSVTYFALRNSLP